VQGVRSARALGAKERILGAKRGRHALGAKSARLLRACARRSGEGLSRQVCAVPRAITILPERTTSNTLWALSRLIMLSSLALSP
jgi:hypothetical protein